MYLSHRLYAFENFYSCRYVHTVVLFDGSYTPLKISTLVDQSDQKVTKNGYTPLKISTLVDFIFMNRIFCRLYAFKNFYSCRSRPPVCNRIGYTPLKISTLVDERRITSWTCWLYAFENFYSCRYYIHN